MQRPPGQMTEMEEAMAIFVASLQEGEVVSFGDVAAAAGKPRAPRAAGRFLAGNMLNLPWWRVVYSDGRLPPCNPDLQRENLIDEGVDFNNGKICDAPMGRFSKSKKRR